MPPTSRNTSLGLAVAAVLCGTGTVRPAEQPPAGLAHRLIVGYQGWFGCPEDFDSNTSWKHWFANGPRPESLTVDVLPSVRELMPEDLCDTGMPRRDGHGTVKLYSAQNPSVVAKHFAWMREQESTARLRSASSSRYRRIRARNAEVTAF